MEAKESENKNKPDQDDKAQADGKNVQIGKDASKTDQSLTQTDDANSSESIKKPVMKTKIKVSLAQAKRPQAAADKTATGQIKKLKRDDAGSVSVAKAFQRQDSDEEEEEEMPVEAKIRMRNLGRFTPTSSGPNSFGKTSQGFVDTGRLWKRKMEEATKDLSDAK